MKWIISDVFLKFLFCDGFYSSFCALTVVYLLYLAATPTINNPDWIEEPCTR